MDTLVPEPGAFYVMDRDHLDFARLPRVAHAGAFFVIRSKAGVLFSRHASAPVDRSSGVPSDRTVLPSTPASLRHYPGRLP